MLASNLRKDQSHGSERSLRSHGCEILHVRTMVATIRFVGIYVESNHSIRFLRCELDFATHPPNPSALRFGMGSLFMALLSMLAGRVQSDTALVRFFGVPAKRKGKGVPSEEACRSFEAL